MSALRRVALLIEYDGSRFSGSQAQQYVPSVQQTLEAAIERLTGERSRAAFAGRTDARVHAVGQVAAFTTTSRLDVQTFVTGLNAWLPDPVAVRSAALVDLGFDPRRNATKRTYRYVIYNAPARSPLWRNRAWQIAQPLDVPRMSRAARWIRGTHDFAAFSRPEPTTTVRCVYSCEVRTKPPLVLLDIEANAFLRQQVRRTAGALTEVGKGKMSVSGFRSLLREPSSAAAGPVAPGFGLYLMRVDYPGLDLSGRIR